MHYFHHAWHQNHPYWVCCLTFWLFLGSPCGKVSRKESKKSVTVRCSDAVEVISLILLFMPISIASSQSSAMVWLTVGRNVHYIQEVPRCVLLFVMQKSFITQDNYTKYEHIQNHIICNIKHYFTSCCDLEFAHHVRYGSMVGMGGLILFCISLSHVLEL